MKNILTLVLGFVVLSACESENLVMELQEGNAVFEGTFVRSSPFGKYEMSEVTLTLEGENFSGTSSEDTYPAICHGTYAIRGSSIEFHNACFWTADFDWSLILSGSWNAFLTADDLLILTRQNGEITDTYELRRM